MIINKIIEHAIDVNDPITLYTDIENNILTILRNMLVGRCFHGCYVRSVNKLIRKSHCEINQDGLLHLATISVVFEVTALVYNPGDIIVGCTVIKRHDDLIICKGPHANIIINTNQEKIKPLMSGIQTGQLIPVRVGQALYNPNGEAISVNGVPFTFMEPDCYRISAEKSSKYDEFIAIILAQIAEEDARMADLKAKFGDKYKFFTTIMSPKGAPKAGKKLREFGPKVGDIVSRGAADDYNVVDNATKCINLSFDDAAFKLMNDYLKFTKMINDSVEAYDDQAVLSHENIWKMINRIKNL